MTIRDPLYIKRPPGRVPQQPSPTANLNVGTLAAAAESVYFMNETGVSVRARYVKQPEQPNGMLQLLTFVAPTMPKNNSDWPNPTLPRRVKQPDQQNGVLQLLTFVAPTMPKNNFDWPNPLPRKPVPQAWNTSQGQVPSLIATGGTSGICVSSPRTAGRMRVRG